MKKTNYRIFFVVYLTNILIYSSKQNDYSKSMYEHKPSNSYEDLLKMKKEKEFYHNKYEAEVINYNCKVTELEELKEKYRNLHKKNEKLQLESEENLYKSVLIKSEKEEIEHIINTKEKEIEKMHNELRIQEQVIEKKESEIKYQQEEMNNKEKELIKLKNILEYTTKKEKDLVEIKEQLEITIKDQQKEMKNIERKYLKLEEEHNDIKNEIKNHGNNTKKQKEESDILNKKYEQSIKELQTELANHKQQNIINQKKYETQVEELNFIKNTLKIKQRECEDLREKVIISDEKFQHFVISQSGQEETIKTIIKEKEEIILKQKQTIEQKKTQYEEMEKHNKENKNNLERRIKELEEIILEQNNKYKILEGRYLVLEKDNNKMQNEIKDNENNNKQQKKAMENENIQLTKKIKENKNNLERRIKELEEIILEQNNKYKILEGRYLVLEKDNNKMQNEIKDNENNNKQQKKAMENENIQLTKKIKENENHAQKEINLLRYELENIKAKQIFSKEKQVSEIDILIKKNEKLEAINLELTNKISSNPHSLQQTEISKEYMTKINELERKNVKYKENLGQYIKELTEQKGHIKYLSIQLLKLGKKLIEQEEKIVENPDNLDQTIYKSVVSYKEHESITKIKELEAQIEELNNEIKKQNSIHKIEYLKLKKELKKGYNNEYEYEKIYVKEKINEFMQNLSTEKNHTLLETYKEKIENNVENIQKIFENIKLNTQEYKEYQPKIVGYIIEIKRTFENLLTRYDTLLKLEGSRLQKQIEEGNFIKQCVIKNATNHVIEQIQENIFSAKLYKKYLAHIFFELSTMQEIIEKKDKKPVNNSFILLGASQIYKDETLEEIDTLRKMFVEIDVFFNMTQQQVSEIQKSFKILYNINEVELQDVKHKFCQLNIKDEY